MGGSPSVTLWRPTQPHTPQSLLLGTWKNITAESYNICRVVKEAKLRLERNWNHSSNRLIPNTCGRDYGAQQTTKQPPPGRWLATASLAEELNTFFTRFKANTTSSWQAVASGNPFFLWQTNTLIYLRQRDAQKRHGVLSMILTVNLCIFWICTLLVILIFLLFALFPTLHCNCCTAISPRDKLSSILSYTTKVAF